jgi:hypothetical protein
MMEQPVVQPTIQGGLVVVHTRVPKYVRTVPLQVPDKQYFDAMDLQWVTVVDRKQHFKVSAIPMQRLDDFVRGEAERGETSVYCRDKGHKTGGVLTSKVGDCIYGRLKGVRGHKQEKTLAQAGEGDRRSKIVHGEGIKMNCAYGFTVKEFTARSNVAFIKFPCTEDGMQGDMCKSMRHENAEGAPAHDGLVDHVHYTEAAKKIVLDRLDASCSVKVTLDGAP